MATAMAGSCRHHKFRNLPSSPSRALANTLKFPLCPSPYATIRYRSRALTVVTSNHDSNGNSSSDSFTWEDVFRISESNQNDDAHDLHGFFDKVQLNNRNSDKQCEFMPFVIEDQIVGYVHHGHLCKSMLCKFAHHLRKFKDVFVFPKDNTYGSQFAYHVTLHPILRTPEDRTRAVGDVVKSLGEELIPGIRNELFPVAPSYGAPVFFSLERAAAPYFGIKAYGVHMNGYVEREGQKFLWIGKRSELKPTYPGMLDHLVAGGLPHGISCEENLVKECEEEAGIPRSISIKAIPVGALSFMDINGYRFQRGVPFCYDLKLPEGFIPKNEDGEVESFELIPVTHVANIIRRTHFFRANCTLTIMDFLFQHGYIRPESLGYLKLLQSLKNGDCS